MIAQNPVTPSFEPAAASTEVADPALFHRAYERIHDELDAVPADELLSVNFDILPTVTMVLGAWGKITGFRGEIAEKLPAHDLTGFDKIKAYGLALGDAQIEYMTKKASSEMLAPLNARATELRDVILADVRMLLVRGLLHPSSVSDFKGLTGYWNVAHELLGLSRVYRNSWAAVGERSSLSLAEIEEAELVAGKIVAALGAREQEPAAVAAAALRRQRAFTLFVRAYDQARRAVSYLRWDEDDADTICPSLYGGRTVSRKKSDVEPKKPVQPSDTALPAPPPAQGQASQGPSLPITNPFPGR